MNDADSKKLEEIKELLETTWKDVSISRPQALWLIAQLAEQSQEIKRLLAYVDGNDKDVEIGNLEARVKELEELMQEAVFDDWFCQNESDFMERWNKALAEKEKK